MSTGELPATRSALGLMTYPPQAASVRAARQFVIAVLTDTCLQLLADDAGLLVSELAANAVLHARTDFDVVVYELDSGVRVSVRDRSVALPVLTAPSATAMSGRGLALVQTLADQWGAGTSPVDGKSVWFELHLAAADPLAVPEGGGGEAPLVPGDQSVEELLAAWSEAQSTSAHDSSPAVGSSSRSVVSAEGPPVRRLEDGALEVVLPALDAVTLMAAKEHMDDLLREVQLIVLDPSDQTTATAADRQVAQRLDAAARGFDDVRRQVRQQVSRVVALGERYVELRLQLTPGTPARAVEYQRAVEAAEALAADGTLLSAAHQLGRHRRVRDAYLGEVIAAGQV